MAEKTEKSWFRKALDKYDAFCKELGVDQGACRSCVPVVRFDEDEKVKKEQNSNEQQNKL